MIRSGICTFCGHFRDWHRIGDDACPLTQSGNVVKFSNVTTFKDEDLFTASDLKAAKLETVERCLKIVRFLLPSAETYTAVSMMENIKEEIENE